MLAWNRTVALVAVLVALLAACSNTTGNPTSAPESKSENAPLVLIMDASGSMTTADAPGPRIDAAKSAANALVADLSVQDQFGLLTYGTGTGSSDAEAAAGCQDVTTLVPLGPLDPARTTGQINGLTPRGYTPISLALTKAAAMLPRSGTQTIVLVSDGEDTCGQPPCDTAKQLKQQHPDLSISTVGFKTEGAVSDEFSCVANATGGLAVTAANAKQLSARLRATRDVDAAQAKLSSIGISGVQLGDSINDLRSRYGDFPAAAANGIVVVVWKDCDLTFADGVLVSIAPHGGGTTIDGIGPGSSLEEATAMYGDPVEVEDSSSTVIYTADADREYAYRMQVDGLVHSGSGYVGTVKTVVLCRCLPKKASGKWTDPSVIVTPHSVGAVGIHVPADEVPALAGVSLVQTCTRCDGFTNTADLQPAAEYAKFKLSPNCFGMSVEYVPGQKQIVKTSEGFELGGTLAELKATYGSRLEVFHAQGMSGQPGYQITEPGAVLNFAVDDGASLQVTAFILIPMPGGC